MKCPKCGSKKSIKNESVHGKAKQKCKEYGRQYIINRTNKTISKEKGNLVDKLLLEKIAIARISRVLVTKICEQKIRDSRTEEFSA